MGKETDRSEKRVDRLHLIYPLIIAVIIIVCISTINFYSKELNNELAFASTLTSIIIGALAIFIAVYQGITQSSIISKLSESADRVDSSTKELKDLDIYEIPKKVEEMRASQDELAPKIEGILSEYQSSGKASGTENSISVAALKDMVRYNKELSIMLGGFIHAYKNEKQLNISKLLGLMSMRIQREEPEANSKVETGVLVGYFLLFSDLLQKTDNVKFKPLDEWIEITDLPFEELKEVINEDLLKSDYYGSSYNTIFRDK